MARYRKVEVAMWNDERFLALSPPAPNGQSLWIYLLTGPRTTVFPGLVIGREDVMASDLGWGLAPFREAFAEVCREGLIEADRKAGLVFLRRALLDSAGEPRETSRPQSPNVLRGWAAAWDEVPDSPLKHVYLHELKAFAKALGEPFAKAFREAFAKALLKASRKVGAEYSHQDQDQDQDQEREGEPSRSTSYPQAPEPPDPVRIPIAPRPAIATTAEIKPEAALIAWAMGEIDAARARVAARFGWTDVQPLHPMDPGRGHLRERIAESGGAEKAEPKIKHALAVAEAEAIAKKTVEYLGGAMFKHESWTKKLAMRLDDARKPPRTSGPAPAATTMRIARDDDAPPPTSTFGAKP